MLYVNNGGFEFEGYGFHYNKRICIVFPLFVFGVVMMGHQV